VQAYEKALHLTATLLVPCPCLFSGPAAAILKALNIRGALLAYIAVLTLHYRLVFNRLDLTKWCTGALLG
jgi:ABC-type uncharacterized transport system permease subunit